MVGRFELLAITCIRQKTEKRPVKKHQNVQHSFLGIERLEVNVESYSLLACNSCWKFSGASNGLKPFAGRCTLCYDTNKYRICLKRPFETFFFMLQVIGRHGWVDRAETHDTNSTPSSSRF